MWCEGGERCGVRRGEVWSGVKVVGEVWGGVKVVGEVWSEE